jgi:hypothetical protein
MTRPNKQEGLFLETLSGRALEFEGKAGANSIGRPFRCFLLGQAPGVTANVRIDWKVIAKYKHSSFFGFVVSNGGKKFYNIETRSLAKLEISLSSFSNFLLRH